MWLKVGPYLQLYEAYGVFTDMNLEISMPSLPLTACSPFYRITPSVLTTPPILYGMFME